MSLQPLPAPSPTRNFIISGTTFWNPGDDFVREGVIQVLRHTFPRQPLNLHFYNFADPSSQNARELQISNKVAVGDLELCQDSIDGIIIPGLSAGHEIKELYRWILQNKLDDRVFLIGAGYENPYCADHIGQEPEATLFRSARVIIGRTERHPAALDLPGRPYVHLNCPALLSVPSIKTVPAGQRLRRIGFSIQLPHEHGIVNQTCDLEVHRLALEILFHLARDYDVEIVAHHKSEYFRYLGQFQGTGIPVRFSSFHQDLHEVYRQYDAVITTRLHSSLFANGHGIPGIIINDTERHSHALVGFRHSTAVRTRDEFDHHFQRLLATNLAGVAREMEQFKQQLLQRYVDVLRPAFTTPASAPVAPRNPDPDAPSTRYVFDSEKKEQQLVKSIVKPGMTVLDVGAHQGKYTQLFSLLTGPEGRVVAFEPTPSSGERLASRIADQGLTNVTLVRQAVGDQVGTVTLHQFPEEYSSWNGLGRPSMEDPRDPSRLVPILSEIQVPATTLDEYCREQGIDRIDYLKVDVEGAEIRVLHGASDLLKRQAIGHLQFEVSRKMLEGLGTRAREVFEFLAVHGYECHSIADDGTLGPVATDSDAFYDNYLALPVRPSAIPTATESLPVHFLTLVLNGQPFIRHHIEVLRQLPFEWHWHIVEGVADLKHDTAWSVPAGGRIPPNLHRDGRSIDGTSEYLDELKAAFPDRVTVYRRPAGTFWDGKLEMVNAPLGQLPDGCLLWQLDADELWTVTQMVRCRALFLAYPDRTAAYFYCHYFVGRDRVITTRDTYGNHSSYEWLRAWRFQQGDRWASHEPPRLMRPVDGAAPQDVATLRPFLHRETESLGLVFQHYAYTTESQAAFKEAYYGYAGAVEQWRQLQSHASWPQPLRNFLKWVQDDAQVDTLAATGIRPLAPEEWFETPAGSLTNPLEGVKRVLLVRTDSIGDALLASSILEPLHRRNPGIRLAVLCQKHVANLYLACPWIDTLLCYERSEVEQDAGFQQIQAEIAAFNPEVILNAVRSRDHLSDRLTLAFPNAQTIGIECDLNNISDADRAWARSKYHLIIPSPGADKPELSRHADFLAGLGIHAPGLQPVVWTHADDEALAEAFFRQEGLDPLRTLALFAGAQHDVRVYGGYPEALAEFPDFRVLIFGDDSQARLAQDLTARLGDRAINLCGKTSLLETAALLRRCRLYVGAESAGAHLACALGVPNVVLLGGGHFGRFMPYSPLTSAAVLPLECFDCNWQCRYAHPHCVKDLAPEVLAEALRQTLAAPSAHRRLFLQSAESWPNTPGKPRWQTPMRLLESIPTELIPVSCLRETPSLTPDAEQHVHAAEAALDRNDAAEGLAHLEAALRHSPNHFDLLTAVADLRCQQGDLPACRQALQRAARLRPDNAVVQVLVATASFRLKDMPAFEAAIDKALQLDPNCPPAHRLLADLNFEHRRFAAAASHFGRLVQQNPDDLEVLLALGRCLVETQQWEGAEACFNRVLTLQPGNADATEGLDLLRQRQAAAATPSESAADLRAALEMISCPFCRSAEAARVRQSADIVQCRTCQTVYLRTRPRKEVMEQLYQTYADDGSHMALPQSVDEAGRSGLKRDYFLQEILQRIEPGGTLIDIGCGWGAFLLNARERGFQVQGLEITRKAAGYARTQLSIPVGTTQFLDTEFAPESSRVITMLHVLEHLPQPKEALEKVFRTLEPGGMFCGIVPNFASYCSQALGEKWYWLDPNYHYVHYTPETLKRHLESAGFIVERLYTHTGDYGRDTVTREIAQRESNLAPSELSQRLTALESEGRGEEIRFFARKPLPAPQSKSLEAFGGETLTAPEVSVVVSTFNAEKLLRPCLENLTRQTIFDRIEIIVVDSGSAQNERDIAHEFAQRYPNIRYLRTERETLYGAWNRGLAIARGRYWANLNTDDSLRDDALEVLVQALDRHPDCALAYGDTAWTTQPNDRFPSRHLVKTVRYPHYAPVETLFYCITGCLQFWRTASIRQLGGFDASLRCAGDYHATLKMMAARMTAVHVPEVLSLFFQNTTGLTQASDCSDREHLAVMTQYRRELDIRCIFDVPEGDATAAASAWTALAIHASHRTVPWEEKPISHMDFTFACLHRAMDLDPHNPEAGMNLVGFSHQLKRLEPDQAELVRRWPSMREWIRRFRAGEGAPVPTVRHALPGPVYRPTEHHHRPTADQLAAEPEALRPWICRIEGRHVYLSEELFARPAGLKFTPEELERSGKQLVSVLSSVPDFYAHFGGAGDALLLLASFYDRNPEAVLLSYPNSIPGTQALLEAFPRLSKIYFLPPQTEAFYHLVLRFAVRELRNCLGAGATPKRGYDEEWRQGLDIVSQYGISKAPRWAAELRRNDGSRQVAVAPKGSLAGMVGSKRNLIRPELWPDLVAHIQARGFEPVLLGVPSESTEYPALPGCIDARGDSFAGQMKRIGACAGLVGADSWAKTFSALAGIPTLVFEPVRGADLKGWKDPSDWVFIEPWDSIRMIRSLDEFRQAFDAQIARIGSGTPTAAGSPTASPKVAWEGSFLDYGSLSAANRELTRRLAETPGIQLECVNTATGPHCPPAPKPLKSLARTLSRKSPSDARITIRHAWPPNWNRPAQGKLVILQPWEFGSLPCAWVEQAAQVDEFWVPSRYVQQVYVESGIPADQVQVIPHGIDPDRFRPDAAPMRLNTTKRFRFLFVGGTIHRKGPDLLLKAYLETFTAADDVCLVIKDFGGNSVYAGMTLEAQIQAARRQPNAPEILYLSDELAPDALPGLYTACHCLVHPYRGEGFGLPVLEAMACGLPVVVTGGGSTDDFATDAVAYRLPATRREIGDSISGLKLVGTGWLLEPDVQALAERLRWVHTHPDEARALGSKASAHARQEWSWDQAVAKMVPRLKAVGQATAAPQESSPGEQAPRTHTLPPVARLGALDSAREHLQKGNRTEAWNATTEALRVRPFHPEAYLLLAEIARAEGNAAQALDLARHAARLAPGWKPAQTFLKTPAPAATPATSTALPTGTHPLPVSQRPRLSVCLITKNEERFLKRCLESVRDLASQIVVVDTGSTDSTQTIAQQLGAEVSTFAWCDDFSAARNAALERATGDWVLILDADEELRPDQRVRLRRLLDDTAAIAFRLPLVDVGHEDEGTHYVPRLFRNAPGFHFIGRIHEDVFSSVERQRVEWGLQNKLGDARLLHHGYTDEVRKSRSKGERNLRLLRLELADRPNDPNLLMSLGLELARADRLVEALPQYEAALRSASAQPAETVAPEFRETLLTQYCTHLLKAKEYAGLTRALRSPLARAGDLTATLHWMAGLACIEQRQFAEGAEHMRQCLALRHQPTLTPVDKNILKGGPYHCLARCQMALRQAQDARYAFEAALIEEPESRSIRLDYARFLAAEGQEVEALQWLHALIAEDASDVQVWHLGGQVALSKPELLEFAGDWTQEAMKCHGQQSAIIEQRAAALLLSGQTEKALPLWNSFNGKATGSQRAAALICEATLTPRLQSPKPPAADPIDREFVDWYRRLLEVRAVHVIEAIHQRMEPLRPIVPGAVQVLEKALAEAEVGLTE